MFCEKKQEKTARANLVKSFIVAFREISTGTDTFQWGWGRGGDGGT